MTEKPTDKLVKFAYGKKENYSSANHSNYVYFASDTPLIHANGMWRGVSKVALSGNNLEITVGSKDDADNPAIVLSASLSNIATTATQRKNWDTAYNFVNSISGTNDTDKIINKWQEVVDFLAGIPETTLTSIMDTKADKATKVSGANSIKVVNVSSDGTESTSNVTLGGDLKISINNSVTAGSYVKPKVNAAGLVTGGSSLVESDIPALSIGKITGLQAALNDKLTGSSEIGTLAPLSGGGPLNEEPTISLNYDGTTLVVDSSTKKLKVGTIAQNQVSGLSTTLAGYVPTSRTISAGNGLTGGGDLTANRTLSVKADGSTINVSSNGISVVSAPKLSTARSLWGNSFDGSGSVSGDLTFVASGLSSTASHGMRIGSTDGGFIGFSKIFGMEGVGSFTGIALSWGANPETDAASVRINDKILTYKGHPIYYKGLAQFTTDVNSLIRTELKPMATDFTALANRVTAVENQLKWIEVTN